MGSRRAGPTRSFRVGAKFAVAVSVLVTALLAVAGMGYEGLQRTDADADRMYAEHLRTISGLSELAGALHETENAALRLAASPDTRTGAVLDARIDDELVPRAEAAVRELRVLMRHHTQVRGQLDVVAAGLGSFAELRRSGAYRSPAASSGVTPAALSARTATVFAPLTEAADVLRDFEEREAELARQEAERDEGATLSRLGASVVLSLLAGLLVVQLLNRSVVPRIRRYAEFATAIAAGRPTEPLAVRGTDELAELGAALNAMVTQRAELKTQERSQVEFVDVLQMTSSEEEAHELMKRHLERSVEGSNAVVLQRNNSANRLQAATALDPASDLPERLVGAEPRSCLAVRFARTHTEIPGGPPALLDCTVCTGRQRPSTCEPLLVNGSVIGAVLVEHAGGSTPDRDTVLRTTVTQAAPVLANLRNLALAEFRANNDSLTGLPNRRATDDTLKRFVAQANRSVTPLAAVMLDLDHFKGINDSFGHSKGDEVLAAVGAALSACLRESDFAGRVGGEEFLVLLPDTGPDGAYLVAEKARSAVGALRVPGIERPITASAGVADLLEQGGNAASLLREADRALYAAKSGGRDRTVVASSAQDRTVPALRPSSATS